MEVKSKKPVGPKSFRGRLAAGILIIIPLAVTTFLIRYVYTVALSIGAHVVNWVYQFCLWAFADEGKLNQAVQQVATSQDSTAVTPNPEQALHEAVREITEVTMALRRGENIGQAKDVLIDPSNPDWIGITLAITLTIMLLYLLGWLGSNVVGRRVINAVESILERIPLVDTIYGAMKRMVHALSGIGKEEKAQRVVLVEFPHENMLAIAFMTNTLQDLNSGRQMATVYVPTTPNPTSGYMEIVPLDRITETDWTMEEALSMILSGGATAPASVRLRSGPPSAESAPEDASPSS